MDWLSTFFLVLFLNLGLTIVAIIFHRFNEGDSPWWEASSFVAAMLWLITIMLRIFTDTFGIAFSAGAMVVQTFFWSGVTCTLIFWAGGYLATAYRDHRRSVATRTGIRS